MLRRVPRALIGVVFAVASASATPAVTFAAGPSCPGAHSLGGGWWLIDPPAIPALPHEGPVAPGAGLLRNVVAADATPSIYVATDGTNIYRSTPGGCSWRTTYSLQTTALSGQPTTVLGTSALPLRISELAVASGQNMGGAGSVYALLTPNPFLSGPTAGVAAPRDLVLRSTDSGGTWVVVEPKDLVGTAPDCDQDAVLTIAPSDSRVVYVECSLGSYYRSDDAGASWVRLRIPTGAGPGIGVDATDAHVVWMAGKVAIPLPRGGADFAVTVFASMDGGGTWHTYRRHTPGAGIGATQLAVNRPLRGVTGPRVLVQVQIGTFEFSPATRRWRSVFAIPRSTDVHVLASLFGGGGREPDRLDLTGADCTGRLTLERYVGGRVRSASPPTTAGTFIDWTPSLAAGGHAGKLVGLGTLIPAGAQPACATLTPQPILEYRFRS